MGVEVFEIKKQLKWKKVKGDRIDLPRDVKMMSAFKFLPINYYLCTDDKIVILSLENDYKSNNKTIRKIEMLNTYRHQQCCCE